MHGMNEQGCGMGGKVRVLVCNDERWVGESRSSENPSVPSYNKLIRLQQCDRPIVCERLSRVKLRLDSRYILGSVHRNFILLLQSYIKDSGWKRVPSLILIPTPSTLPAPIHDHVVRYGPLTGRHRTMVCRSLPADLDGDPVTQVGGTDTRTCLLDRMLLMYDHLTMHWHLCIGRSKSNDLSNGLHKSSITVGNLPNLLVQSNQMLQSRILITFGNVPAIRVMHC